MPFDPRCAGGPTNALGRAPEGRDDSFRVFALLGAGCQSPPPKLTLWNVTLSRKEYARPCALRGPTPTREWRTEATERSRQASPLEWIVDPPSRATSLLPTPSAAAPPGNATARPRLHHRSCGIELVPLMRVVLRGACLATGHFGGVRKSGVRSSDEMPSRVCMKLHFGSMTTSERSAR